MQYVQRSDCRAANLQSFAAARHFCSAKILAGGLRWGWGPQRSRQRHRPRKEISRGNLLCAKSGLPDLSYPRPESAQKYVTTPDWKNFYTGQPRGVRGKSPEEPLPRGSFGQLLRGGSTPRFFSQIRSVGSKPTRLAGYCQSTPGPWTTGPAKKPPAAALGSKKPPLRAGRKTKTPRGVLPAKGSTIWQNFCPSINLI